MSAKSKRNRAEAESYATTFVASKGGPISLEDAKSATVRTEPPASGFARNREVWTIRGMDWIPMPGLRSFVRFVPWRQDPIIRDSVPCTAGATRWLLLQHPEWVDVDRD